MAVLSLNAEEPKVARTFLFALQPSNNINSANTTINSTFPKSLRLRKRADFVKLADSQNKITVKGFLVVWRWNDLETVRLGITASRKIGSAVVRNKVKRRVREVFRHRRLILPAVDINIIARRDSVLMEFQTIEMELEKAFRHIGASTCSRA